MRVLILHDAFKHIFLISVNKNVSAFSNLLQKLVEKVRNGHGNGKLILMSIKHTECARNKFFLAPNIVNKLLLLFGNFVQCFIMLS